MCRHSYILIAASTVLIAFMGCRSSEDYKNERAEFALKHLEQAKLKQLPRNKVFSLPECIKIALEQNLNLKVNQLEAAVARESRTAEMLGMLPDLTISNNLTSRTNEPGSSSKKLDPTGLTYGASTSADQTINEFNIDLALSVIDFGLAYFNTMQANDKVILRDQQTERAGQNLTLNVVKTYYQVAASQRAIKITKTLLERCRNRAQLLEELGHSKQISPFRMFDEHKRFIDLEKRLTGYIRTYESECIELRALLGYLPNTEIKVDDSTLDVEPKFYMPETDDMEQIALLQRPELFETDIQRHIAIVEGRKTILMMFPNVRIFVDFTNSNNSFLYNSSWWELGVRAAYNLLKLPQQIAKYRSIDKQIDAAEQQTYALAIGVISQVRIAETGLLTAKERMDINKRVYKTYTENRNYAKANMQDTGAMSQLELDRIELETAETEINYLISLGECYVAYYRIMNTMGVHNLDEKSVSDAEKEMAEAKQRIKEELDQLRTQAEQQKKESKNVTEKIQTAPEPVAKTEPPASEKTEK